MRHHNIIKKDVLDLPSAKRTVSFFTNMIDNIGVNATYQKWTGSSFATGIPVKVILQEDEDLIQNDDIRIRSDRKFELIVSTKELIDNSITAIHYKDKFTIYTKEYLIKRGSILFYGQTERNVDSMENSIVVKGLNGLG